jgi:glutathione S-transferase
MFIKDNKLPVEEELVDLMTGAHLREPYISINPNGLVPTLDDDGFILTESSAILKYLADKFDRPAYPKDLKKRAKVNELMDWFNTNFYRDYGYGVVCPQLYPHHKRPSDEIQKGTVAWGKGLTKKWLQVLNDHWLGKGNKYLTGDEMTIADYFGAALLTCGDPIRTDFKKHPHIQAWLDRIAQTPNWTPCNEAMYGFRDHLKAQRFEPV